MGEARGGEALDATGAGEGLAAEPPVPVRISAGRTVVRLAEEGEANEVVRFYLSNREHLRPWDPERPEYFFTEAFWRSQLRQNLNHHAADSALRLFVYLADDPLRVIGNISLSNITRGVAQSCTVGYSLDASYEGQGLMREALRGVIDYAFSALRLHRIEANYMPHNRRSGALLRRLGFVVEGYSRDYIQIAGHWEDHVRTALLNPAHTKAGEG